MRPDWESGLRGRLYALGRRAVPLSWRRALRRRVATERLLGLRKPEVALDYGPAEPGPAVAGRADVLVLPVIPWTYRRQRPQQLAEALARRGRRVFYGSLEGSGEPADAVRVAPGVTLVPIAGVRREDPADRPLEAAALASALEGLAAWRARFSIADAAVLVQTPYWQPLAQELRRRFGWRVVYDCLDAHEAFAANRPGVLDAPERALAAEADMVVATSAALARRLAARRSDVRLLPNAGDPGPFARLEPPRRSPRDLVVGYVGAVDDWFDAPLVAALARLRPQWRFEIVGGVESPSLELPRAANVLFHGERPYGEMPGFHARFDVEMIPFRPSPLTHATDPVKLYEAAAAGRAVVATSLESLRPFAVRGLVRLADTAEEFAAALEAAAAADPAEAERRRAFARDNTWDARAAALDAWLTPGSAHETVRRKPNP
ncbi:MAG TPA: glycosyltransferase [Thermoanaerobaculia bacterium]|nr:glycosyltransferase [Thermoanaerobaculia bacterium]